jgi:nitric oxide reductase subunit B
LAVLWIVVSWVSFALFVLPYFGVDVSERKVLGILGLGAVVSVGILVGIYASYMQLLPDNLWFLIGAQGRPVITQGSVWLILVAVLVFYIAYLFYKASGVAAEPLRPFARILSIALAGTAFGAFIGALPVTQPWDHFTVDEYFRWITIHSFVEGFWPPIIITILVSLLIITGILPVRLGLAIVGVDAVLEIATGMIGTAHHYYWGGQPTFWLYVGALFSTLEVIPIGFLIAYALVIWRKGEITNELQKTLLTFILIAAFGGAVGVVAFGAGMINMPVINYYIHGSQGTMIHAHLAMPLAYGISTILMWVVAFYLSGAFGTEWLRRLRVAGIIFAVGFYLQVTLSLGLIMPKQFSVVVDKGYWSMKSLFTPEWSAGFWAREDIISHVWSRMLGDLVSAAAIAIFIIALLTGFLKVLRSNP